MTTAAEHRHDISDRSWPWPLLLPGSPGKVGGPVQDSLRFSNAVFGALRTGATRPRTTDTGTRPTIVSAARACRHIGILRQMDAVSSTIWRII